MPRFDTGVGARQAAGDRGNTDDTVIRRRKAAGAGVWATSEAKQQLQRCEGGKVQVTPSAAHFPIWLTSCVVLMLVLDRGSSGQRWGRPR